MAVRPITGLALCAGAGGLELGLGLALGERYRTVGYVERDAFAAATLVARMEDTCLAPAPIWDDLSTFDGRPWRGRVDLVSAGFPCQPWSAAGRRQGIDDNRWLWPHVARIVAEVGPGLVLLENVPGLLAGGLGPVLGDLANLGFDAEWSCLSAAAVGATHKRERFWLLAYRHDSGLPVLGREPDHDGHSRHDVDRSGGSHVADPRGEGRPEVPGGPPRHEGPDGRQPHAADVVDGRGEDVADAEGEPGRGGPRERHTGRREPQGGSRELADATGPGREGQGLRGHAPDGGLWPPGPNDSDGWERALRAGLPQPSVRRVADGLAHRLDRLHTIGNGVVPLVAAHAFLGLARRAGLFDGGELR